MITVPGSGRVAGTPDVVRLRLAVSLLRPTAAEALAEAEAAAVAVRSALAAHGVEGADAASGLFRLGAEQVWSEQGPRVTGYRCDHEIVAAVRQVGAVGRVLADVLAAGGDAARVDGVEPQVEDDAALRVRARQLAWADAQDRATRLAALAGRPLGQVVSVTEGDAAAPGRPEPLPRAKVLAAGDVSVQPGDVDVVVTLAVQWQLG